MFCVVICKHAYNIQTGSVCVSGLWLGRWHRYCMKNDVKNSLFLLWFWINESSFRKHFLPFIRLPTRHIAQTDCAFPQNHLLWNIKRCQIVYHTQISYMYPLVFECMPNNGIGVRCLVLNFVNMAIDFGWGVQIAVSDALYCCWFGFLHNLCNKCHNWQIKGKSVAHKMLMGKCGIGMKFVAKSNTPTQFMFHA